jgi:hypothetical protein
MEDQLAKNISEIILYRSQDDRTEIQVTLQDETVWLNQAQMAELFQKDVRTINEHIKNIYTEGELDENPTIRNFRIVQMEKKRRVTRSVAFYNLDMIISVGYRVNSHRGTQFRIWATQRLKEYIVKGFVMDDRRLAGGAANYFDELVQRVRRIRASEKNFMKKFAISLQPASTMIPKRITPDSFMRRCKTNFTTQFTDTRLPNLLPNAWTAPNLLWA